MSDPTNGRPKIEITPEQLKLAESLSGIGCTQKQIASILGMSEATLERRAAADETVREALARGRASAASKVMSTAFKMATSGKHPYMTAFWLKCRLRWSEPKGNETPDDNPEIKLNYKE